ncbi:MAG: glycoside hydrolase family 9 protein, partial [Muribaculaceae bacterium]|nr:glycoside hydrolase family 9 protein [Muribaculaceae bacterium]
IILPEEVGYSPKDPHSAMSDMTIGGKPGVTTLYGGLVDGPIYTDKFNSLWGVHLRNNDPYADLQNPLVVYHDDYSDYSTNEPTMDGTASLTFMLGELSKRAQKK